MRLFFIADEIFNRGFYEDILSKDIETFLDLGCNMGTFTVYLKHFLNRKDIKGILIDANSECEQEVLWHIKENELNSVYFYNGLVTYNDYLTEGRFYINESDAASSMYAEHDPNEPKTFYTKKLIVPYVNVIKIWEEVFPNKRCNLLKIDIEGSEKEFVVKENIFFEITDAILLEWHGWVISLEELENRLLLMGFKLKKIIEDRESRGVAYFEREKKVF